MCTHRSGIRLRLPQAQVGLSDLSSGRGSIIPESFAAIQACVVFFFLLVHVTETLISSSDLCMCVCIVKCQEE